MSFRREKAEPDTDSQGNRIMTERYVRALCLEQDLYETPRLNDKLYLHYKAFNDIRNLESYVNVKTLWLENNCIAMIQNLQHMKQLRFLYLQNNRISKIENLEELSQLVTLNLAHNSIRKVEGLAGLLSLEDLNLSHNYLMTVDDLQGLKDAQTLMSIDLTNNKIERPDGLLELLSEMKKLGSLYMKGNQAIRGITNYRKMVTITVPTLLYLDDRPIFELDRLASEAWHRGGKDEEMATRRRYQQEKDDFDRRNRELFVEQAMEVHRKKMAALEAAEKEKAELKEKVARMRMELMEKQGAEMEAWMAEIDAAERKIQEEIDLDVLVPPALKPGTVTYRTVSPPDSPPDVPEPEPQPKKPTLPVVSNVQIDKETLETSLLANFFNFEAVSVELSERLGQLVTAPYLQEVWTKYQVAERNPLLDELD